MLTTIVYHWYVFKDLIQDQSALKSTLSTAEALSKMSHRTDTRLSKRSGQLFYLTLTLIFILLTAPALVMAANIKPGDEAPMWPPMADMDGEVRSLENHIGKNVVMLDFWSIYCVSCIQEMPSLVALYDKYKDQGFVVYGVDLDSFSPKRVERFIKGLNFTITYPVIIDRKRQIASAYEVSMLPTTIIIGKDGKVKLFHIGYKPGDEEEFDHLIKDLVK